ncbi:hypothetical protein BGX29_010166 [Mortierella sp. GBA35]|nr:hypothetical protein BGX29_010166 [Mortierella sp. GBA35]
MDTVAQQLFLSCPESLEEFMLHSAVDYRWKIAHIDVSSELYDEKEEGPVVQRQEPIFEQLKSLWLPKYRSGCRASEICPIFEQCPAFERLEVPSMASYEDMLELCQTLRSSCPRLHHLISDMGGDLGQISNVAQPLLHALPEQQATTITLKAVDDSDFDPILRPALQRHSRTIRELRLTEISCITGATAATIFAECYGLEKLELSGMYTVDAKVSLKDLIAVEWVCTNMRELDMVVDVDNFYKGPHYYISQSASKRDEEGRELWIMAEAFVQKLGTLTALEVLDLKGAVENTTAYSSCEIIYYREFAIPGMMRLSPATHNDPTTPSSTLTDANRPGFLHYLAGLKKLRILCGSVRTDAFKGFDPLSNSA